MGKLKGTFRHRFFILKNHVLNVLFGEVLPHPIAFGSWSSISIKGEEYAIRNVSWYYGREGLKRLGKKYQICRGFEVNGYEGYYLVPFGSNKVDTILSIAKQSKGKIAA